MCKKFGGQALMVYIIEYFFSSPKYSLCIHELCSYKDGITRRLRNWRLRKSKRFHLQHMIIFFIFISPFCHFSRKLSIVNSLVPKYCPIMHRICLSDQNYWEMMSKMKHAALTAQGNASKRKAYSLKIHAENPNLHVQFQFHWQWF